MRWLTPIILIVVLLTAACGHDPGGKDKIAVIDWDKAFSAHPKQTVLKQGEAELQKLLRYREEQAEIAKTQIAGLTRLQQLKQNSKANFMDAGFQTQMYAAEAKERKKLLDAYDAAVKEADAALAEQEKELEDAYQLKILNFRLRLEAEIRSEVIGEAVMNHLEKTDQIAYVRFASVYRQFADVNNFMQELQRIMKNNESIDRSDKE